MRRVAKLAPQTANLAAHIDRQAGQMHLRASEADLPT